MDRGEYNPATTRVLHMRRNPASDAADATTQGELRAARAENEALRRALERLESEAASGAGGGGGGAPGAAAKLAEAEAEVALLKQKARQRELARLDS